MEWNGKREEIQCFYIDDDDRLEKKRLKRTAAASCLVLCLFMKLFILFCFVFLRNCVVLKNFFDLKIKF